MKELIKNIFKFTSINITILDQCIVSSASFIMNVLLARALGVDGFGLFSLLWVAVLFVSSMQLALIIYPMLTLASMQEKKSEYLNILLFFQLVFSLVASIFVYIACIFLSSWFSNANLELYALPIALVVMFHTLQDFLRRVFFLREAPSYALLTDLISYGGRVVLMLLLFNTSHLSLYVQLYIIALSSFVGVVVPLKLAGFYKIDASFVPHFFYINWAYSKWLLGSSLLQWVTGNLFVVAASALLGPVAAGVVRVCQNLMGPVHVLFLVMDNFVPVRAAERLSSSGKTALKAYFWNLSIINFGFISVVIIIVASLPVFWIELFYGSGYTEYGGFLRFFVLLYFLVAMNTLLKLLLRTIKATKLIFIADVFAALLSVLVAYPIINEFGLNGVILGTALSLITVSSVLIVGFKLHYTE